MPISKYAFTLFQISHYQDLIRNARTIEERIWLKGQLNGIMEYFKTLNN